MMQKYRLRFKKGANCYEASTIDGQYAVEHYDPICAVNRLIQVHKRSVEAELEPILHRLFRSLKPLAVKCKIKYQLSLYVYVFLDQPHPNRAEFEKWMARLQKKINALKYNKLLCTINFCTAEEWDLVQQVEQTLKRLKAIEPKDYIILKDLFEDKAQIFESLWEEGE